MAVTIFGIVNLTEDSFSDGGCYLEPAAAIEHALALAADGADVIDLGPASSAPESADVSARTEIARLAPVMAALAQHGVAMSVDSWRTPTQRFALERGAAWLNDIRGFEDAGFHAELAASGARLVVMHSIQRGPRATREHTDPEGVLRSVFDFFDERVATLEAAGIGRDRLVLDPGMGLFLGADPAPSVLVLRRLADLRERYGCEVMISVSRKSLVGRLAGRAVHQREAASLAAELFAIERGATMIRTHEPRLLRDGLNVLTALQGT
ncbi:MAG TPA: dihydropteroate synthase [Candidatus Binatia bacterium]|nr:dihydropteroate synthase [Candidatus Binatia bacterium]